MIHIYIYFFFFPSFSSSSLLSFFLKTLHHSYILPDGENGRIWCANGRQAACFMSPLPLLWLEDFLKVNFIQALEEPWWLGLGPTVSPNSSCGYFKKEEEVASFPTVNGQEIGMGGERRGFGGSLHFKYTVSLLDSVSCSHCGDWTREPGPRECLWGGGNLSSHADLILSDRDKHQENFKESSMLTLLEVWWFAFASSV